MAAQINSLLETSKTLNQFTSIPTLSQVQVVPSKCTGKPSIIEAEEIKDADIESPKKHVSKLKEAKPVEKMSLEEIEQEVH